MLLNAEVLERVGERNARNPERDCVRWGQQDGSVFFLEQKLPVNKPRIRTKGGGSEVELEIYKILNDKEFLNEQAAGKLLSGSSTRRFRMTLQKLLDGKGVSRQTISARAMDDMAARLQDFRTRQLPNCNIVAVLIDGIHLGDMVYVVALGIDDEGKKHVLGFEAGSTENAGICRAMLRGLLERGILREDGCYLFVVDGSKGVKSAIKAVFAKRGHTQRCIVHKKRNVKDKLPKHMHEEFDQKFNAAFNQKTLKQAEKSFSALRQELLVLGRSKAAESLTEGLYDLLTLHRLGINGILRRSLYSTNAIESIFSSARYYTRNVKRWRKDEHMERWIAAGLLEAEKSLRRIPGYTNMKKLIESLERQS